MEQSSEIITQSPFIGGVYRPEHRRTFPHKLLAFDIETQKTAESDNAFMCGSIYGKDGGEFFQDRETMIKRILSERYKNHWIFATSLDFDFFSLFTVEFFKYGFIAENLCWRGSHLISVRYNPPHKEHERRFLDTMNFYPASVEKLGDSLSIKKLPQPAAWKRQPENDAELEELKAYNMRDAEITYKWIDYFQDKLISIDCTMRNTIASTSMWYYRNRYQKEIHFQPHIDIMQDMRKAYYGGRTECFKRGLIDGKSIYIYDVNAMYPFAMTLEFPRTESLFFDCKPTMEDVFDYHGVTLCDIKAPNIYYPVLPFRNEDGKLLFPTGSWKSQWYSNIELRKAAELGYEIQPKKAWLYSENYFPFSVMQRTLYKKRQENPDLNLVFKLIANSLYGKFAESSESSIVYKHISEFDSMPVNFKDVINEFVLIEQDREVGKFVNPIFSIYTAAYARLLLYAFLNKLDGFYCDTDSIFSFKKIEPSLDFGALKLEKKARKALIVKPKVYFLNNEFTKDSIKAKGMKVKTYEEFEFMLAHGFLKMERITRFKESVRQNIRMLSDKTIEKRFNIEDDKRHWDAAYSRDSIQDSQPILIGGAA